ncbi:DUF892 family protein [Rhizobium leguminosarum]|nr:DUF892 family protein [Rhizobium leguminosarum]
MKAAFDLHLQETEGQVERLVQGVRTAWKAGHGKNGRRSMASSRKVRKFSRNSRTPKLSTLPAAAQALEQHEIARYGTLKSWAMQLGMKKEAELLQQTLVEEIKIDETLTQLAEPKINQLGEKAPDPTRPRKGHAASGPTLSVPAVGDAPSVRLRVLPMRANINYTSVD